MSDAFVSPIRLLPHTVWLLTSCPDCNTDDLVAVTTGMLTNYRCNNCQACWHQEIGWVRRIEPDECLGCGLEETCAAVTYGVVPAGM